MKITIEILKYWLLSMETEGIGNFRLSLEGESISEPEREAGSVCEFVPGEMLLSDAVYVLQAEKLSLLPFSSGGRQAVVIGEVPADRQEKKDNLLYVRTDAAPRALTERLRRRIEDFLRLRAELSEGILRQSSPDVLFSMAEGILDRDFAIVDLDMNIVHCTPGYSSNRGLREPIIPRELFQDLISSREFHLAAEKKSSFYYYSAQTDSMDFCRNIFAGGQYVARVVVLLREGEQKLPAGEEQLFELLADTVQHIFTQMNLMPRRQTRERLRKLCERMLSGAEVDVDEYRTILNEHGWREDHLYLCAVLRFPSGAGWNAQLLTVLPYLSASLEAMWTAPCAVSVGEEIYLILDVTREKIDNISDVLQKLAYFVRDNLCRAGISPVFSGVSGLRAAGRSAVIALEMGSVRRPDFWYHRFEDCRLPYLLSQMKRELPPALICHPAVEKLREHDRNHGTALTETLQSYLDCNLNMTAASERLYIHRTTFCRRMRQIRTLTGLNPDDPDTVLSLMLSFRLWKEA